MCVFFCLGRVLTLPVSCANQSYFCDKPGLFHACCGGLGTYTRFHRQTRVPPVTNFVLLMHLAVVLYLQVVYTLTVDPLADVQHAVEIEDLRVPETPCASR